MNVQRKDCPCNVLFVFASGAVVDCEDHVDVFLLEVGSAADEETPHLKDAAPTYVRWLSLPSAPLLAALPYLEAQSLRSGPCKAPNRILLKASELAELFVTASAAHGFSPTEVRDAVLASCSVNTWQELLGNATMPALKHCGRSQVGLRANLHTRISKLQASFVSAAASAATEHGRNCYVAPCISASVSGSVEAAGEEVRAILSMLGYSLKPSPQIHGMERSCSLSATTENSNEFTELLALTVAALTINDVSKTMAHGVRVIARLRQLVDARIPPFVEESDRGINQLLHLILLSKVLGAGDIAKDNLVRLASLLPELDTSHISKAAANRTGESAYLAGIDGFSVELAVELCRLDLGISSHSHSQKDIRQRTSDFEPPPTCIRDLGVNVAPSSIRNADGKCEMQRSEPSTEECVGIDQNENVTVERARDWLRSRGLLVHESARMHNQRNSRAFRTDALTPSSDQILDTSPHSQALCKDPNDQLSQQQQQRPQQNQQEEEETEKQQQESLEEERHVHGACKEHMSCARESTQLGMDLLLCDNLKPPNSWCHSSKRTDAIGPGSARGGRSMSPGARVVASTPSSGQLSSRSTSELSPLILSPGTSLHPKPRGPGYAARHVASNVLRPAQRRARGSLRCWPGEKGGGVAVARASGTRSELLRRRDVRIRRFMEAQLHSEEVSVNSSIQDPCLVSSRRAASCSKQVPAPPSLPDCGLGSSRRSASCPRLSAWPAAREEVTAPRTRAIVAQPVMRIEQARSYGGRKTCTWTTTTPGVDSEDAGLQQHTDLSPARDVDLSLLEAEVDAMADAMAEAEEMCTPSPPPKPCPLPLQLQCE